jgi:hypothetical protein
MGLPFSSGHVLAMRRFPAASIGPGYTSVWHRAPDGRWTFWQDAPANYGCARYFSGALTGAREVDIELSWPDEATLHIVIAAVELDWTAHLSTTTATRVLGAASRLLPERGWRSPRVLRAMGKVAGRLLGAGKVNMVGTAPNGQRFLANPQQLWAIDASTARLGDDDFGPPGPVRPQAQVGEFQIPQRGIFAIGRAFFYDAAPT